MSIAVLLSGCSLYSYEGVSQRRFPALIGILRRTRYASITTGLLTVGFDPYRSGHLDPDLRRKLGVMVHGLKCERVWPRNMLK